MTGMPPIAPPILQIMIFELIVLAATVHLLYQNAGLPILPSLFLGLLVSRAVLFFCAGLLGRALGLPPQWASAAALLKSFPAVIAILILVPPMVGRLLHESVFRPGRPPHDRSSPEYFNRLAPEWDRMMPPEPRFREWFARFGVARGDRVLDIGAGTGRATRSFPSGRIGRNRALNGPGRGYDHGSEGEVIRTREGFRMFGRTSSAGPGVLFR